MFCWLMNLLVQSDSDLFVCLNRFQKIGFSVIRKRIVNICLCGFFGSLKVLQSVQFSMVILLMMSSVWMMFWYWISSQVIVMVLMLIVQSVYLWLCVSGVGGLFLFLSVGLLVMKMIRFVIMLMFVRLKFQVQLIVWLRQLIRIVLSVVLMFIFMQKIVQVVLWWVLVN